MIFSWKKKKVPFVADLPCQEQEKGLDPYSATWVFIRAWLEKNLESAREMNDGPLDSQKTATIRGRIALMKEIINLPNER